LIETISEISTVFRKHDDIKPATIGSANSVGRNQSLVSQRIQVGSRAAPIAVVTVVPEVSRIYRSEPTDVGQ